MLKKSYMDTTNILNEGFFKELGKFFRNLPKLSGTERKKATIGLKQQVDDLNKGLDDFEKSTAKWLPDDYPPLPRYTINDFIK